MTRLKSSDRAINSPILRNRLHRPANQLRQQTESMLREMAFVLQLTRRVKEQILEEKEETVGV